MKNLLLLSLFIFYSSLLNAQASGNVNYQMQTSFSENNIDIYFNNEDDFIVNIKGLANLKADHYVAIFNISQVGKTSNEVNNLLNERVNKVLNATSKISEIETYVDMISFVPMFDYDVERKLFSKNTYNEIPAGFELKKNLHIQFTDPSFLNELISICTKAEIYDLVRVDYFSTQLDSIKSELKAKANLLLKEKVAEQFTFLNYELIDYRKQVIDGFKVVYPLEMYESYQAYSSSSLNLNKAAQVNQANKSTTLYYQPIMNKEFDFVINPVVLEPVIQIMYEVKFRANRLDDQNTNKEYILIAPNGDFKPISID